jgi:acyl-ACP thioesterase
MYYTTNQKANYYDCDAENRLKISAAMKYMQQTSSEHLESLGLSPEKLMGEGMVFLLSKMNIKVHRMPLCTEKLVVGTAAVQPRGVRFLREFVMDSESGERLISALSLWVLVVPASRKIIRPKNFPYNIDFQEAKLTEIIDDVLFPKDVALPENSTNVPVNYSLLDCNAHVNNTHYADLVCDALPYDKLLERGLDTLILSFQNEAKWGDTIQVSAAAMADGGYYVAGRHDRGECFEAVAKMM